MSIDEALYSTDTNLPSKPEQLINALEPIEVTELGITSDPVKPEQPLNAEKPILVRPVAAVKSTDVNPVHSKNA